MSGDHTPGPWKPEFIGSPRVLATDTKGDFPICDIRGWGHLTGKGHGALGLSNSEAAAIQDANARLVAAAPDLLEFARWVEARGGDNNQMEIFKRARAAIAKATGSPAPPSEGRG